MIHVSISEEIIKACPDLHVAVVACDVKIQYLTNSYGRR